MPRTRKSGDGGLYFDKKRKLWLGTYPNGFTEDGRPKQARVSSKSQTIARQKLQKLIGEIESHGSPLGNKTVAEWGALWLPIIQTKKPGTYRSYLSVFTKWIQPAIGRKNLKDVRPSDLRGIYQSMAAAGKSSSTALKAHTVMSSMFEDARLERLVPRNVAKDIRPPKAAKTERDSFTPAETLAILKQAETLTGGSKWITSLYAGIRQGERLGATIDSVDFDRGLFTVQWNLVEGNYAHGCGGTCPPKKDGKPRAAGHCPEKRLVIPEGMDYRRLNGRYLLVPPKSGEPRTFPLPPALLEMLAQQVARLDSQPNPYGLLWPASNGSPVTSHHDQDEWTALLAAAKVVRPGATTHWARHTAISDLTASGVPERVIGEIVGHKSAGVTGRYQHVSSQDAADAMGKLGERRQIES